MDPMSFLLHNQQHHTKSMVSRYIWERNWTCSLSVRMVFSAHGIKPCITNSWTNTRSRSWSLSVRCAPCRTGVVDCVLTPGDFVTGPSVVTDISCILSNLSVPFGADGVNSLEDSVPSTWHRTSRERDRLAGANGWSIVVMPSTSHVQFFNQYTTVIWETKCTQTLPGEPGLAGC